MSNSSENNKEKKEKNSNLEQIKLQKKISTIKKIIKLKLIS